MTANNAADAEGILAMSRCLQCSVPPAAPTLMRLPGQGLTGSLQGTGPESACRHMLARRVHCGVANILVTLTEGGGPIAGLEETVAG